MLLLAGQDYKIGFTKAIEEGLDFVVNFVDSESLVAAGVIFGILIVFHAVMGSAELIMKMESSRFANPNFWIRIIFVGIVTFTFSKVVIGNNGIGTQIAKFSTDQIAEVVVVMVEKLFDENSKNENKIDYKKVMKDEPGQGTDIKSEGLTNGFFAGVIGGIIEVLLNALMILVVVIATLFLMLYIIIQAFIGLGSAFLTMAVGPICLAFGSHEGTQDIAFSYLKSFLVNVVLFLPLLVLAFRIGLIVMTAYLTNYSQIMPNNGGSELDAMAYLNEKFLGLLIGPLAGIGIILGAPGLVKGVLR
jgi:hypothetical protein